MNAIIVLQGPEKELREAVKEINGKYIELLASVQMKEEHKDTKDKPKDEPKNHPWY